jgi:NAD(P)H-dependent FMN reductase/ketosteroid isomerase-like protein
MREPLEIVLIIGSLRKESFTRKFAHAAMSQAPEDVRCRIVEIGDLAMYNQDLDGNPPAGWERFRSEITDADGVLFLTPEYNRSIPACIKNAIDVGSRPEGKNLWDGKPAGIISVTPYKLGAFGANHALRQALVFINVPVMQQPEAYIGNAEDLLETNGTLTNKETAAFLKKFMLALTQWVETITSGGGALGDFPAFLANERDHAATAYVRGDPKPLDGMVATEGEATFFHPQGAIISGAGAVKNRYDSDAKTFGSEGESILNFLHKDSGGDLAFWAGTQEANVEIGGKSRTMTLRITEIFRRKGRGWILIHRHADAPAT